MTTAADHPVALVPSQTMRAIARWVTLGATVALGLGATACCHNGEVLTFTATPNSICAGEEVVLTWDVKGPAELKAEPPPPDWKPESRSKGTLTVRPHDKTLFTVTALDANPAKGRSYGTQPIEVEQSDVPKQKGNSAECNETTHVCTAKFKMPAGPGLNIAKLSSPLFVQAGVEKAHEVCVTPPQGQRQCVPGGGSVDIRSVAAGDWLLEATLAEGETATPPPQLRVTLGYRCSSDANGGRS